MQLEDYFNFISADDIRLRGHRIGIETILLDYLGGATPEEIQREYSTLSLEEVRATIAFYWQRKEYVDAYLQRHLAYCAEAERRFDENPPEVVLRMRELKRRIQAGELVVAS